MAGLIELLTSKIDELCVNRSGLRAALRAANYKNRRWPSDKQLSRSLANEFFMRIMREEILLSQVQFCSEENEKDVEKARSHIKSCLECREQLRHLCNEITELIRPRTTKELG